MKKGLLIVLSGPSGVGKHTLWHPLLKDKKLNLRYSISMTTRNMRPGEKNGREYFFVTKKQFQNAIRNKQMFEYAQYIDNYYGTPKKFVEDLRNKGKNILLEIDVQGGLDVIEYVEKNNDDHFASIFISPPSLDELLKRLKIRGTESKIKINKRVKAAKWEVSQVGKYQYEIVNDQIQIARRQLKNIILKEIKKHD